jgi:hypothetical protein
MTTKAERTLPTAEVVKSTSKTFTDKNGRTYEYKHLGPMDRGRLYRACGDYAENNRFLVHAALIFCVTKIDSLPVLPPRTVDEIDARGELLGDDGLEALTEALKKDNDTREGEDARVAAKNSQGAAA